MSKTEITWVEELITRLCCGVIAYPKNLELTMTYSGDSLTKYTVRGHAADAPRLMGKGGERFRALRFIMRAAGAKLSRQMSLETMTKPVVGQPEPFPRFKFNPGWPKRDITALLRDTCQAVFHYDVEIKLIEAIGSAILKVSVDAREPQVLVDEATPAIQNIFCGIGVTNGCQLSVDIGRKV